MSHLSDKREEHVRKCQSTINAEEWAAAKFHAAKVAQFTLRLASKADGKIARHYVDDAFNWISTAKRIEEKHPTEKSPSGEAESSDGAKDTDDSEWIVGERPDVSMDDIAGMDEVKRLLHEMILEPMQNAEAAKQWGIKRGGGILMYGPPGNGKTTIAKAIAHELDCPFYLITGATIRSKWSGEAEKRIHKVLHQAKAHPLAVLFIDDMDGLLPRRGGSSVVDNRIVTEFLNGVGGFGDSENALLLLGATNKPWEIDDAVFRTGRFDEKLFVGLPDQAAREGILRQHFRAVPLAKDVDLSKVAAELQGYTGSDIVGIVDSCKRAGFMRQIEKKDDTVVMHDDIGEAMTRIPKSATGQMMNQYQEFRKQRA